MAGSMLEGFPANPDIDIDLVMVRPAVSSGSIENTSLQNVTSAEAKNDKKTGAHGLALPTTYRGVTQLNGAKTEWHLSLWPDQSFQLLRSAPDGSDSMKTRASLGRWHADPSETSLVLHEGAEMPLKVRVAGNKQLEVIDANSGAVLDGMLKTDGTLETADLDDMLIAGMMTYMADAAVIEECLSGRQFPIAQEGDYLALETAYLADRAEPGAPLYVMMEGGVAMREGMEGRARQTVTVDRFIKTRAGVTCARQLADASLRNTFWRLDELNGTPFPMDATQREPHIVLETGEEGAYRATVGCNQMRGGVTINDTNLSFAPGASTMMACPPPLDVLEQQFSKALSNVTDFAIKGETLVLSDVDGKPLATFTAIYF